MAQLVKRGNAINVVYPYIDETGKKVSQWETYHSDMEAVQRHAVVDLYQKKRDYITLAQMAAEYKVKQAELNPKYASVKDDQPQDSSEDDNLKKTFQEFYEKWFPIYCQKHQLEPSSIDSLEGSYTRHILPYFGNRTASKINAMMIDEFVLHLSNKKCGGAKSYYKRPDEIPTLSSASVNKIYGHLYAGLRDAKEWGFMKSLPHTSTPRVKSMSRPSWTVDAIKTALQKIDDRILHLAVHMGFMCSLRPGELVGIELNSLKVDQDNDPFVHIRQSLERVKTKHIEKAKKSSIFRVFPQKDDGESHLVLKSLKTHESKRIVYLADELMAEINDQIAYIEDCKEAYGSEYHDYGLLFCHPNGDPIETTIMAGWFKKFQIENALSDDTGEGLIDMQGLRKAGQTYKIDITDNIAFVSKDAGHTAPVAYSNYYDPSNKMKKKNMRKVANDFYGAKTNCSNDQRLKQLIEEVSARPEMLIHVLAYVQQMQHA